MQGAVPATGGRAAADHGGHQQRRGARRHDPRTRGTTSRDNARTDTRDTTILVAAGPGRRAARGADPLLRPDQLDARARSAGWSRAPGGSPAATCSTRVEVGGPVEIATLGRAFNEMANSLERDARERDRLERMKDEFVLTASHELRSPVTSVKGFAEMLTPSASAEPRAGRDGRGDPRQRRPAPEDDQRPARPRPQRRRASCAIEPEPTRCGRWSQDVGRQMRPRLRGAGPALHASASSPTCPRSRPTPTGSARCSSTCSPTRNKYCAGGRAGRGSRRPGSATRSSSPSPTTGPALGEEQLEHIFERFSRARERRDPARRRHRPRPGDLEVAGRAARRRDLRRLDPGRGLYLSLRAADRQGRPTDADGTREQDDGGGRR